MNVQLRTGALGMTWIVLCLLLAPLAAGASSNDEQKELDRETRAKIIEKVSEALADIYVFEDVAN